MAAIDLIDRVLPPWTRVPLALLLAAVVGFAGREALRVMVRSDARAELAEVVTPALQRTMVDAATLAAVNAAQASIAPVAIALAANTTEDKLIHAELERRTRTCCP